MKIGIDVRYLSHAITGGIATFLSNLMPELLTETVADDLYLYADQKAPLALANLPAHATVRTMPYRNMLSSVKHDAFMRGDMARDGVQVAHFPANVGLGPGSARTVLTIHDEINLMPLREIWRGHRKQTRVIGMMTYLHFLTRLSAQRADVILTVSEYARQRIASQGGIDPSRIVPVWHGCPADMRVIHDQEKLAAVRLKHGIQKPFILAEALKNPAVIVKAWRQLPAHVRAAHEIVFFARTPNVLPVVHEAVAEGHARFLCQVDRQDLIALFNMARTFVFPSWIEGFGIPLLEAMACGAPVIASNRAAIPEIVGSAGLLMDADDADTLTRYLTELLESETQRQHLRARGLERVTRFTWTESARQIVDVYRGLAPASVRPA